MVFVLLVDPYSQKNVETSIRNTFNLRGRENERKWVEAPHLSPSVWERGAKGLFCDVFAPSKQMQIELGALQQLVEASSSSSPVRSRETNKGDVSVVTVVRSVFVVICWVLLLFFSGAPCIRQGRVVVLATE